jgi:hypothetical protein
LTAIGQQYDSTNESVMVLVVFVARARELDARRVHALLPTRRSGAIMIVIDPSHLGGAA